MRNARIDITIKRGTGIKTIRLIAVRLDDNQQQPFDIALVNNEGAFIALAPGRYMLSWYLYGKDGSAIKAEVKEGQKKLKELTEAKSKIKKGGMNAGTLIFDIGATP